MLITPHNVSVFQKNIVLKNAYDNFAILNNNKKPIKKLNYAVVVPDYVNITYDFIIALIM